ncbi:hypothetical protein WJX75_001476 [Coccomyxa subellipsoidea]|uniref:Uncharacterized protein n=1 Tax=Coccomyxa subellipsoidea TaxID=248742 RepID=A0ABR2YEV7_9CHLO
MMEGTSKPASVAAWKLPPAFRIRSKRQKGQHLAEINRSVDFGTPKRHFNSGPEVSQEFSKVRQSIVDGLRNWYGKLLPPAEPLHSSGKAVASDSSGEYLDIPYAPGSKAAIAAAAGQAHADYAKKKGEAAKSEWSEEAPFEEAEDTMEEEWGLILRNLQGVYTA